MQIEGDNFILFRKEGSFGLQPEILNSFGSSPEAEVKARARFDRQEEILKEVFQRIEGELREKYGQNLTKSKLLSMAEGHLENNRSLGITARNITDIALEFGISVRHLLNFIRNKEILDIGAGLSNFAEDSDAKGLNAKVTSLDAIYLKQRKELGHGVLIQKPANKKAVVALADEPLPFRDGQFDIAIATWSLPAWASSGKQVKGSLSESMRVVKTGGFVMIAPGMGFLMRPSFDKIGNPIKADHKNPLTAYALLNNELVFLDELKELESSGEAKVYHSLKSGVGNEAAAGVFIHKQK